MKRRGEGGFTLVEMLVSLTVLLFCLAGLTQMMLHNSRINKAQQLTVEVQASARNCLALVEQRLRSAGWDPLNAGFVSVVTDTNLGDNVSELEIFADLDEDGATDSQDEQILIRHVGREVVWRRSNDVSAAFEIVAANITNDADGDGTIEPMFSPSAVSDPIAVTVTITAESPVPDPMTGEYIRYTIASDVALRKAL